MVPPAEHVDLLEDARGYGLVVGHAREPSRPRQESGFDAVAGLVRGTPVDGQP